MSLQISYPVSEIFHPSIAIGTTIPGPGSRDLPADDLAAIVRLTQSNDRLFTERDALISRLGHARAHLADPGCNRNFATAYLEHLKLKHAGVVARLRANRLEARQILARLDRDPAGEV